MQFFAPALETAGLPTSLYWPQTKQMLYKYRFIIVTEHARELRKGRNVVKKMLCRVCSVLKLDNEVHLLRSVSTVS